MLGSDQTCVVLPKRGVKLYLLNVVNYKRGNSQPFWEAAKLGFHLPYGPSCLQAFDLGELRNPLVKSTREFRENSRALQHGRFRPDSRLICPVSLSDDILDFLL